jgi:ferritin
MGEKFRIISDEFLRKQQIAHGLGIIQKAEVIDEDLPDQEESGIEQQKRLSESILALLNTQIKNELESSQIYRAMSCWAFDTGWLEAAKYYFKSAQEELKDMDNVYLYVFDKNAKAVTPACPEVPLTYENMRKVVEASLAHEINVTANWKAIADKAMEEKDHDTYALAQGYLKEQIEEENKFRDMLQKMNLKMPDYEIDELFKM